MASPSRTTTSMSESLAKEMAERARRIAAMLDRWDHEDVSGEPDWNVEDLEPMMLRGPDSEKHRT
jgi:hypothetical protein